MRTINEMNELHVIMDGLRTEVELVITGLSRFTSVMQAISDIKKMAIQAEVCYTTCQVPIKNGEKRTKISLLPSFLLDAHDFLRRKPF